MNAVIWDRIETTLAEAAALSKENEKGLKELKESVAATSAAVADLTNSIKDVNGRVKNVKDTAESSKKSEISMEELKATVAATSAAVADLKASINDTSCSVKASGKNMEKSIAELTKSINGVNGKVDGIGASNGMIAEDYFYESLRKSKTIGGVHFDLVRRNIGNGIPLEDGTRIDDEYDTVMYNNTAVCIVEVKYKVESHDVRKLAKKRVHNFKKLFPMYANYKIYLAFGGLTFGKCAVDAADELGVGILTFNGDAVEIHDKNLKAY